MKLPDLSDFDLDEIMNDPDKRAKLFLYLAGAMIIFTILFVIGIIVIFLRVLHVF
jgi:type IV secretory pathway component VirB8